MENVVLVDSCIFIDLLRRNLDPAVELLRVGIGPLDLATCGMVRMEVTRGLSLPAVRKGLDRFLDVMLNVPTDNRLWIDATELAWQLDRAGTRIPPQDILIASCALRIGATVLTLDKHFDLVPGLRTIDWLG